MFSRYDYITKRNLSDAFLQTKIFFITKNLPLKTPIWFYGEVKKTLEKQLECDVTLYSYISYKTWTEGLRSVNTHRGHIEGPLNRHKPAHGCSLVQQFVFFSIKFWGKCFVCTSFVLNQQNSNGTPG